MFRFIVPFLALTVSSLTACQSSVSSQQGATRGDTAVYELHNFYKQSKYIAGSGLQSDTTFIKISYPQFQNEQLNALVKPALFPEGEDSVEQISQSFLDAYDEFAQDASFTNFAAWYTTRTVQVYQNTPLFVSLINSVDEYTGGAHGNQYKLFKHFDIQAKKEIILSDLIDQQQQERLLHIAEEKFRAQEKIAKDSSLSENFFFDKGQFSLADNFALEQDNLLFYYNPYEVKSYAEGDTELRIPLKDIKNLLSATGLKYFNSLN